MSKREGRLTYKQLLAKCAEMGISVRNCDGEIRINFCGETEETAYYTNCKDDALATAKAMVARRKAGAGVQEQRLLRGWRGSSPRTAQECRGHATTWGPIGNVVYCDGSCKS